MDKRSFGKISLGAALALAMRTAWAQEANFPSRPLRLVVPYPPGGGSDILARAVAPAMGELLGQSVLVDNRPGAATIIGAETVARSAPDGYSLLLGNVATLAVNPSLFKEKLPYSPTRDFRSIGMMGRFGMILVANPNLKARSLTQLIDLAKRQNGSLNYASPGIGSPHHLAMELLKDRAGIDMTHVAYKGIAPAIQDLIAGQVLLMVIDTGANATELIKSGRLQAIASFSDQRLPGFEDVPTTVEAGFHDLQVSGWQGLVVPASVPDAVVGKLSNALISALKNPAVSKKLMETGITPAPMAPGVFDKFWRDEGDKWRVLIEKAGIKLQ